MTKNFAPRSITREECERLTASPTLTSSQESAMRAQMFANQQKKVQEFRANVAAALASPEVDTFKQFLATLDRDAALGLLTRLGDDL